MRTLEEVWAEPGVAQRSSQGREEKPVKRPEEPRVRSRVCDALETKRGRHFIGGCDSCVSTSDGRVK